jgi:hypothetical protein
MSEIGKSGKQIEPSGETPAGLTRRQWLLRLGEAAALAGFSGISPDNLDAASLETSTAADLQSAAASASSAALPPGLYDASADHLTHVLMRDQRFVTPPPGSETEYAQPHPEPFVPAFFTADEFPVVRRLVLLTLNASTGEPVKVEIVSAAAVDEVAQWIDLALSKAAATREAARHLSAQHRMLAVRYYGREEVETLENSDPPKVWRDGLAWLHQQSAPLASDGFLGLPETQQTALLHKMIPASGEAEAESENAGLRLGRLLKRQAVEGYYTSQAGLKEIDYQGNAFHGESPGCPNK